MMKTPEDDFVSVYNAAGESAANVVRATLEAEGIYAIVRPRYGSALFDGVFALAEGSWGDILVPKEDAERAIEILEGCEQGQDESG